MARRDDGMLADSEGGFSENARPNLHQVYVLPIDYASYTPLPLINMDERGEWFYVLF